MVTDSVSSGIEDCDGNDVENLRKVQRVSFILAFTPACVVLDTWGRNEKNILRVMLKAN